jgi:hypothetical protein
MFSGQHPGEVAEIGSGAGLDDNGSTGATQSIAAHKTDIRQIGRRISLVVNGCHRFFDRHRLAGKRRLVQE